MKPSILSTLFCLALAALLSACGGGIDELAGARAFVAQVASHATPERRRLGAAPAMLPAATATAGSAAATAALPSADETLDWAEYKFPTLFPKGPQSVSLQYLGISYTVRSYLNGNHLGITLDDTPAPVTPQSGALFFTGDHKSRLRDLMNGIKPGR